MLGPQIWCLFFFFMGTSASAHDGLCLAVPGAPSVRNPTETPGVLNQGTASPTLLAFPGQASHSNSSATSPGHQACLEMQHSGSKLFCSPTHLYGQSRAQVTHSWLCLLGGSRHRKPHWDLQLRITPASGGSCPLPCGSQLEQPQRHATGISGRQLEEFCPFEPEHRAPSHASTWYECKRIAARSSLSLVSH